MARHGNVRFEFAAQAIPLLSGALAYARDDVVPGGLDRNRDFLLDEGLLTLEADIPPALAALLFDPQTSGGLLAAYPRRIKPNSKRLSAPPTSRSGSSASFKRAPALQLLQRE